jgi:hypothetical protein
MELAVYRLIPLRLMENFSTEIRGLVVDGTIGLRSCVYLSKGLDVALTF